LLLGCVITAGCADGSSPGAPTETTPAVKGVDPSLASLSHAIALAMEDAGVREQVRDDMRASPYSLHKLVLQEYVSTPGGQRLMAAAAKAASVSQDALAQRIAALPRLDFYVLLREHRMSWQGEAGVAVVTQLSTARTMVGHTERGVPVSYSFTTPAELNVRHTLFTLQVSELEAGDAEPVRAQAGLAGAGSVIQDRADDDVGLIGEIIGPDGKRTTVDPRDARSVRAGMERVFGAQAAGMMQATSDASASVTAMRVGTTMTQFVHSDCRDVQDCWPNTMEIEHKTWLVNRSTKTTVSGHGLYLIRRTGVMEQTAINETVYMSPYVPNSSGMLKLIRTETDNGSDDHYGPYYYDYNQDGYHEFTTLDAYGWVLLGTITFWYSYY
jgi:hypothetical protein